MAHSRDKLSFGLVYLRDVRVINIFGLRGHVARVGEMRNA